MTPAQRPSEIDALERKYKYLKIHDNTGVNVVGDITYLIERVRTLTEALEDADCLIRQHELMLEESGVHVAVSARELIMQALGEKAE